MGTGGLRTWRYVVFAHGKDTQMMTNGAGLAKPSLFRRLTLALAVILILVQCGMIALWYVMTAPSFEQWIVVGVAYLALWTLPLAVWRIVRRRAKFSLRTLLLFVTLSSCLLASLMVAVDGDGRERRVLARISELGGSYHCEHVGPTWLQGILGAIGRPNSQKVVRIAALDGTPVTDRDLEFFAESAADLRFLMINRASITDQGLEHIGRLSRLQCLVVSRTNISDKGLVHLARLPDLWYLDLSYNEITGESLVHVKRMDSLRYLELNGTRISDADLDEIAQMPSLLRIGVADTQVTPKGRARLRSALSNASVE